MNRVAEVMEYAEAGLKPAHPSNGGRITHHEDGLTSIAACHILPSKQGHRYRCQEQLKSVVFIQIAQRLRTRQVPHF